MKIPNLSPYKYSDTSFRNRSTGWSLEHWLAIEWYSMEILKLPVQPGAKVDQASRVLRPGHGCLTYSNAMVCGSATVATV